MERGANQNLAMLCNSCSSGGGEVTYPNGTKVSVRNTPNVTDGECGIVEGYSHCASLLRVNFGSRTVFCSPDNCAPIDSMTKDEKIKEVMELASEFARAERNYYEALHIDVGVRQAARECGIAEDALESKLRELIQ